MAIGFYLCFGPLILKAYRLHRIFNAKSLRTVAIKDMELMFALFGLILLDVLILIVLGSNISTFTVRARNCGSGALPFAISVTLEKVAFMLWVYTYVIW